MNEKLGYSPYYRILMALLAKSYKYALQQEVVDEMFRHLGVTTIELEDAANIALTEWDLEVLNIPDESPPIPSMEYEV